MENNLKRIMQIGIEAIKRQEKLGVMFGEELKRIWQEVQEVEEIKNDHIRLEDPFFTEREN